ncbi:MAG TPA: TlpA disulfide reductase family protein [Fimbriimonadaceae bacterium]|nr:TlpA disulfide reductase family protein [Fimbriimonadaceae bacterium]
MERSVARHRSYWLALAVGIAGLSSYAGAAQQKLSLRLDGAVKAKLPYYPVPITLSETKPAGIRREPAYRTTPRYGTIRLGDGPRNTYFVAVDEPDKGDWKIYIDKNQNGDLTDDGDGAWNAKKDYSGRTQYGVMNVTLRASYGHGDRETSSAKYEIGIYRIVGTPNPLMYRESAREGKVTIGGATHKAILVENDADGIYANAGRTRPIWLLIDSKDNGSYDPQIDIRGPFKYGNGVYQATIAENGTSISIEPTDKPVLTLTVPRAPSSPLLKAGSQAPDFTAEKWGGGTLKLSDYRGKIVILDFWATWCGPCQKSMPHIERVSQEVKDQQVAVIGVCVWDTNEAYEAWMPQNREKYTFQFAFDPAGKDAPSSIAMKLFHVTGIPTTYIIDKDGNVADAIVGYDDGDTRVEKALKKLGVQAGN